jgi:hypothetical protein
MTGVATRGPAIRNIRSDKGFSLRADLRHDQEWLSKIIQIDEKTIRMGDCAALRTDPIFMRVMHIIILRAVRSPCFLSRGREGLVASESIRLIGGVATLSWCNPSYATMNFRSPEAPVMGKKGADIGQVIR